MNDLIYRDQAIETISKLPVKVDNLGYTWMIASDVVKQIDGIPSAEPEGTAKVIDNVIHTICCEKCKRAVSIIDNYCPGCGAKLDWNENE